MTGQIMFVTLRFIGGFHTKYSKEISITSGKRKINDHLFRGKWLNLYVKVLRERWHYLYRRCWTVALDIT